MKPSRSLLVKSFAILKMNDINVKLNKGEKSGEVVPAKCLRHYSEEWKSKENTDTWDFQLLVKWLCEALESRSEQNSTVSSCGIHDIIILVCS